MGHGHGGVGFPLPGMWVLVWLDVLVWSGVAWTASVLGGGCSARCLGPCSQLAPGWPASSEACCLWSSGLLTLWPWAPHLGPPSSCWDGCADVAFCIYLPLPLAPPSFLSIIRDKDIHTRKTGQWTQDHHYTASSRFLSGMMPIYKGLRIFSK